MGAGWDPTRVMGGRENRPSPGSKPTWSMHQSPSCCQTGGRAGCPPQGHGCRAAFCSSLAFVSLCLTLQSPHARLSCPGRSFPASSLQLPGEPLSVGTVRGGPIPAQERSGPFPCEDAAPQPSEAKEMGKESAPVHRASTGTGTCNSDGACPWVVLPVGRNCPFYSTDSKPQQMSL